MILILNHNAKLIAIRVQKKLLYVDREDAVLCTRFEAVLNIPADYVHYRHNSHTCTRHLHSVLCTLKAIPVTI